MVLGVISCVIPVLSADADRCSCAISVHVCIFFRLKGVVSIRSLKIGNICASILGDFSCNISKKKKILVEFQSLCCKNSPLFRLRRLRSYLQEENLLWEGYLHQPLIPLDQPNQRLMGSHFLPYLHFPPFLEELVD